LVQKNITFGLNSEPISFSAFILRISVFTEILPVFFYFIFSKKIHDKSIRVIFFAFTLSFINDIHALYSIYREKEDFLFNNIYVLLETLVIYYFFSQVIHTPLIKKIILWAALPFVAIWFFYIFEKGTLIYLNTCIIIENFSILIFSLIYYYENIIKKNVLFTYTEPKFWIISAYFIYSAGTFFLFLYLFTLSDSEQEDYYNLNYVFNIIRTILLCVGLTMHPKKDFD
jgi:hypothetical protein